VTYSIYIGLSAVRTIKATDWTFLGIANGGDTVWSSANSWSIDETTLTAGQIAYLATQSDFRTAQPAPRVVAGAVDNPFGYVTHAELAQYFKAPPGLADGQLVAYSALLGQLVGTNPAGTAELAYAENNTGVMNGPFAGAFAFHDITGCSIVVPASVRPVYIWAACTVGTTTGASGTTPLYVFPNIVEVSNGVDTPITWQGDASTNTNNSAFPVIYALRRLGPTARARTFKLQFSNASTGSWSAWNGNSGTEPSRIGALAA